MNGLERRQMVQTQLVRRGIANPRVLDAFRFVPRERVVPPSLASRAYQDAPIAIGDCQTLSRPYIVALIAEALQIAGDERVLEIGTGSGDAAAILSRLAAHVATVERVERLAVAARNRLEGLGFFNVSFRHGDGTLGWPEHAHQMRSGRRRRQEETLAAVRFVPLIGQQGWQAARPAAKL